MGEPSDTNTQSPTFEANAWRDFQEKFDLLAMEDQDQSLRARWTNRSPLTRAESDLIEAGLLCWLYMFEQGFWHLTTWSLYDVDGRKAALKERYAALATRAGTMLRPPRGVAPLDFWLHNLYLGVQATQRGSAFFGPQESIEIEIKNVCNHSAAFCSRLEKKALETPASALNPHSNKPSIVELNDREKNIWNVICRGSKGRQYCREVDSAGIRLRRTGVWKGAPLTYLAAFDASKTWRHRIEDEKSKIKRKAKLAKPATKLAGE